MHNNGKKPQVPEEVRLKHCQRGFAITHLVQDPANTSGIQLPNGVPPDKWDTWCGTIVSDEMNRIAWCGVSWALEAETALGAHRLLDLGPKSNARDGFQGWLEEN